MHTFSLTVFSIIMAVISYFQSVPLKVIQPVYSIPERLQEGLRRVNFGGLFDKVFQKVHGNNLSVKLGLQTVPTPTVPNSTSYTTRNVMDRISMIGNWDSLTLRLLAMLTKPLVQSQVLGRLQAFRQQICYSSEVTPSRQSYMGYQSFW